MRSNTRKGTIKRKKLIQDPVETEKRVKVRDNGVGIDKNHIGDIFNMFFRAIAQDVGSGFGLYNVKAAVTKTCEITVDSEINEGTRFKFHSNK